MSNNGFAAHSLADIEADEKARIERITGPAPGTESSMDVVTPMLMIQLALSNDSTTPWTYYPLHRDRMLRRTYKQEPMMAGAVYSLSARMKALRYTLSGGRNTKAHYQEILGNANDGEGFHELLGKTVTDLLTQDNGAFWFLEGPGDPLKPLPAVTNILHLDSEQCWRTHDKEFPVIYTNPYTGTYHKLHRSRVVMMSSHAQPDELARSVGFCGVSRALKLMQFMRNVAVYKDEKVSGNFKRGIIFGNGFTTKNWSQAMTQADALDDNSGRTIYRGIPVLLSPHDKAVLDMLDLASLPDGFEYEKELTLYIYALALVFGVDAREFWPATASGATKADASIQHLKAQGKGFADVIQIIEHAINWQILPRGLEFMFDYTDDEQDLRAEQIRTIKITNIQSLKNMGVIDARGAQILCVLRGAIDVREMEVIAQATSLQDTEEVDSEAPVSPDGDPLVLPPLPIPEQPQNPTQQGQQPPQQQQKDYDSWKADKLNYADLLAATLTKWGGELATSANPFDNLDDRLNTLIDDYVTLMHSHTSYAYRQGLNGNPSTAKGIKQLKAIGATSEDYFKTSFIPDLKTAILAVQESQPATKDFPDLINVVNTFIGRIKLYAGAWWNALWAGFGDGLAEQDLRDARTKRVLDPTVDNCIGCQEKAKTYETFRAMIEEAGLPGDGTTPCLGNCHCYLQVEVNGKFVTLPGQGASIDYSSLY